MNVLDKLYKLRELMKREGIDAYLINDADMHDSEYVNEYYKERSYMSNFNGSNGWLIVTLDNAYLWTDGRYFLQAEIDLKDTTINLMKMGEKNAPTLTVFLKDNYSDKVVGLDTARFSYDLVSRIKLFSKVKSINLVDEIWTDRKPLKTSEIYELSLDLVGEDRVSKINRVREKLEGKSLLLTTVDDIAWLFNLRGNDVPITPVFLSFAYISKDEAHLFINEFITKDALESLNKDNIIIHKYNDFSNFLKGLKNEKISVSFSNTNYSFIELIKENNEFFNETSPTILMKAIKNETEIKNNIEIHKADGLAIFRFMKYIKENFNKVPFDEFGLACVLEEYRKLDKRFNCVSFETISSWQENAAIIHYEPTKETSKKLTGTGFLLVDSGGQYNGGTTDITRTYELGEVSDIMKHHYTLVLRSHIDLAMIKYAQGCGGISMDLFARNPLWREGIDYNHGTGHGVGYMLNVHESPNGFRYRMVPERNDSGVFYDGMITTDEPGIYIDHEYGIRIENELLSIKSDIKSPLDLHEFKTITLAPIDLDPVNVNELTQYEKEWLNNYHKEVYNELSKLCNEDELDYLKYVTREI